MPSQIKANIVDLVTKSIYLAELSHSDGIIQNIDKLGAEDTNYSYLIPGLVDAHVHIESSMLIPSEFAKLAVVHGTVATVSDPHEIANVNGIKGVNYMINNAQKVPFHFNFGAPSCVPATNFENAGAVINSKDIENLLARPEIKYLAEMMNFPGVLYNDEEVHLKLQAAHKAHKVIDGHAPGLRGEDAKKYFSYGISTDHECFSFEEGLEKASLGVKILIREGSAAKNFEALIDLFDHYPNQLMFCSDDKHPNDLVEGHINLLIKRALAKGKDFWEVLAAATINPINHYKLDNGYLQIGQSADMVLVSDLKEFKILSTWISGELVAENGKSLINCPNEKSINNFNIDTISKDDLKLTLKAGNKRCIKVLDGEIVTEEANYQHLGGEFHADTQADFVKIVVVNRYNKATIAKAIVHNTGLKKGAFASSVAHDSHNIVAIGCNDEDLVHAINIIIQHKGGISAAYNDDIQLLALPVAGLMSTENGFEVAEKYSQLDSIVKNQLGSTLTAPFMTASFLALLVIPKLKLSDKGLFDGSSFSFVEQN